MPVAADVADALAEPLALGGVETGGGLVEQEDLRVGGAGPCDRHELALALAEVAGLAVARASAMPTRSSAACDRAVPVAHRCTPNAAALTFSSTREVVVELERLERAGEAARGRWCVGEPVDAVAVEHHRARGPGEAGDGVDRRSSCRRRSGR